jgi:hypothetical protein
MFEFTLRHLALLSILPFLSLASPAQFPRSSGIQWSQCDNILVETAIETGYNGTINCANLTVPLDYTTKTSNATIQLNLLHVPIPSGRTNLVSLDAQNLRQLLLLSKRKFTQLKLEWLT